MPKRFGTDGIRGLANASLSAELAVACGRAVALACRSGQARPVVIVGRDTRVSGDMLEGAVVSGLCSGGADVLRAGILPTPGVAFLTSDLGAHAGVVLSASHNPFGDNGIKVFGPGGWKLASSAEDEIELLLDAPGELPTGDRVGRARDLQDAEDRYVAHLAAAAGDLGGVHAVVDCAHGAAFRVAPRALREAGVRVTAIHDSPDGMRINERCGAMHPDVVAEQARRLGAIGLTLDGDADRVLAADETGRVVDGDAIIAMIALRMRDVGTLRGDAIVVTVMSNQALRAWCAGERIGVVTTPVGDRNVLEELRSRGLVLGGEQSGHVIRLDHATTGDGVLTAIALLGACEGRLADAVPFRPLPQVLENVRADGRLDDADAVWEAVAQAEARLGESGRVLVRASGTEPLVRVMVEAPTAREAQQVASSIAAVVRRELALEDGRGGR